MNELYPISNAPLCDNCGQLSYNQVTTKHGDMFCPDCAEQYTCYVCGSISPENELRVFDGELRRLCVDCNHAVVMERASCCNYDLTPIHEVMHDAINRLNQLR